jgi:hypothetical protein
MGLVVHAYSNLKPADCAGCNPHRTGHITVWPDVYRRTDDLRIGCYETTPDTIESQIVVGSYLQYTVWKDRLSRVMLDVGAQEVYRTPEIYDGQDFFELLFFSYSEGIIGPRTSRKLALDFRTNEDRVRASRFTDDEMKLYTDLKLAFSIGADNGLVSFG